jgi:hypothetical protein
MSKKIVVTFSDNMYEKIQSYSKKMQLNHMEYIRYLVTKEIERREYYDVEKPKC